MKVLLKHVFSKQEGIPVILSLSDATQIGTVSAGEWLGVSDENGDYFEVLTRDGFGWVKKSDCESSREINMPIRQTAA